MGYFAFALTLTLAWNASAQNGNVRVEVRSDGNPVVGATVVLNGTTYTADAQGVLLLTVRAGAIELVVIKEGLAPTSVAFQLRSGEMRTIVVELQPQSAIEEQVTVSATRTRQAPRGRTDARRGPRPRGDRRKERLSMLANTRRATPSMFR